MSADRKVGDEAVLIHDPNSHAALLHVGRSPATFTKLRDIRAREANEALGQDTPAENAMGESGEIFSGGSEIVQNDPV